ncbi:flagellar hook-basal body complex protein [Metasolibacillus meyeri]|uniref:Flagellar hook protein FlgE n=1 Tax=Metasolibacillus meyeri TaxID=1071052 RepID=A0AAW9NXQ6_9BACL|nr:flagellar hook-basal body complex protein [Metasolibacillus meyeri]MEC1179348.1 flagellar hook-basal body complex protein [Metasolibacillus meyeri]
MLRSMYSGISGLKNFQTKLDVIGNNIANVNTHGFKKGRVIFKDLMSQTQAGASGPSLGAGGINAKQVGLGATIAAIDTIHGTGSRQFTGRVLDIAIQGEGFFVVGKLAGDDVDETLVDGFTGTAYTRAGNFYRDREGFIVNSNGDYVIGWMPEIDGELPDGATDGMVNPDGPIIGHSPLQGDDPEEIGELIWNNDEGLQTEDVEGGRIYIPADAQEMSIGEDGVVTYVSAEGILTFAGQIMMATFPNAEGLTKVGNNYFQVSANSGPTMFGAGSSFGIGQTVSSALEMSNVDLSEEFTEMIVAQRGFQANTRIITTSDEILQELVNLKR